MKMVEAGELKRPEKGRDTNNHIHTTYSFSPYSPSKAVWMAFIAGLSTAGIMDHDTISGAREFIEAGRIAGIATTIGVECRVDFSRTSLKGRRINNPDQESVAYVALHGIPHTQIDRVMEFFKPYIAFRNIRNVRMVAKLNALIKPIGTTLDFGKDVVPLSKFHEGGSITERHILYALSLELIRIFGKGAGLLRLLKDNMKLNISPRIESYLEDAENPYYEYDLLGLLKGGLVERFYIDAGDECPDVRDIIGFAKSISAISAYAYLGDVGDSVTGDKKAQKFEDSYLEQLFDIIKELGFNAVTYMPSRNNVEQLERVRRLCERYDLFQISGEDINSPRQPFICEALRNKRYQNLYDAAWALVGHELAATSGLDNGMFSPAAIAKYPLLEQRIDYYKERGKQPGCLTLKEETR
jgi:hypothetical protein